MAFAMTSISLVLDKSDLSAQQSHSVLISAIMNLRLSVITTKLSLWGHLTKYAPFRSTVPRWSPAIYLSSHVSQAIVAVNFYLCATSLYISVNELSQDAANPASPILSHVLPAFELFSNLLFIRLHVLWKLSTTLAIVVATALSTLSLFDSRSLIKYM